MSDKNKSQLNIELQQLRRENSRLKELLNTHGIAWKEESNAYEYQPLNSKQGIKEKISIFRALFRGRSDVYPLRWQSSKGKSGYSPACENEWKDGICNKPSIKCKECPHRNLKPVTDQVIYDHLAGNHTIGIYPLLKDDSCYFLAIDFDEAEWQKDSNAFIKSCRKLQIPASLEISRSGNGAHVWIFFSEAVPARNARHLGAALISYTCNRTRQLSLSSYDRLFPNQDTLPKGGFGNLIALPLQKQPRKKGCSVFVNDDFQPYNDQWAYLRSIQKLNKSELTDSIQRACGGHHPIDVSYISENELKPWRRPVSTKSPIDGPLPSSLSLVLVNQIYIPKKDLPHSLRNRLIRLAAFQNPEFYKAQAMHLSVWNKPRIIGCAENYPLHIGLPRGCLNSILELLDDNNIQPVIHDERVKGHKIKVKLRGALRKDQKTAVNALHQHECGVLSAPTAFGKTVTAAALIARRKVSTLILVHRVELLKQWQEQLMSFLDIPEDNLGVIGGGKKKPSGIIDIAIMQSLLRRKNLLEFLDNYGQIIVDECHHISAFSFESIIKKAKARYVFGLTATPFRRDGHHPIIFMQCGPVRYIASRPEKAPDHLKVWVRSLPVPDIPDESPIQEIFLILANDKDRNNQIIVDVLDAYKEGRKILVLTERTDHIKLLHKALENKIKHCFVLHGRVSKKQRTRILSTLEGLDDKAPRVLMATGRLIGEGFDHPPLDTLILTMPISWKGTLQQYAGRLHRDHADKTDVRIYDYVEKDQPQLRRMWKKRQRGYRTMGYKIE